MRQAKLFEHFPQTSAKKRKARRAVDSDEESAQSSDSDVRNIDFEEPDAATEDGDDDEDDSPRRISPAKKRRRLTTPPETSGPPADDAVAASPRASGSRKVKPVIVVDSDDDEPVVKKKRLRRGQRPPTPEADELNDLDQSNVLDTRLRRPAEKKKSKFSEALERMKRKKKQRSIASASESEDEEEDGEDADADRPFAGAKPTEEYDSNSEGSVQDFIVADEGNPTDILLPAQFRTQQALSHHFKIICQYYVHMACSRNRTKFVKLSKTNEYFAEPLGVMRRKLSGLQDSLVTSSVWRTDFKNALRTYPELTLEQMTLSIPNCDACHIGGRVSTLVGHLGDSRYNTQTFEHLPDADEDDESARLPMMFHLGRFCARRTRVFHRYAHWEHELFSAIEMRVRNIEGYRNMDPDDVVRRVDESGWIDFEWKRMNELIESARKLEVATKRGEDNDIE